MVVQLGGWGLWNDCVYWLLSLIVFFFNGGKFHAKNAKIFAKSAKTFNDGTIGTVGTNDCSLKM